MYLGQTRGLNKGSGAAEQVSAGEVSPYDRREPARRGAGCVRLGVGAFLEVVMRSRGWGEGSLQAVIAEELGLFICCKSTSLF